MGESTDQLLLALSTKLDSVMAGQSAILVRLGQVEDNGAELTRTIRGFNGTPGMVSQVALQQQRIDGISSDVDGLKTKIDCPDRKTDAVTWRWVVDKAIAPVATAFLLWLLITILPQVLGHLGN